MDTVVADLSPSIYVILCRELSEQLFFKMFIHNVKTPSVAMVKHFCDAVGDGPKCVAERLTRAARTFLMLGYPRVQNDVF